MLRLHFHLYWSQFPKEVVYICHWGHFRWRWKSNGDTVAVLGSWKLSFPTFATLVTKNQCLTGCFWCWINFPLGAPYKYSLKGSQMGSLPVLISLCFRENVIVTWKILSFLCSWDNLLLKNEIVFFFENQISKWCSFEKRTIFDLLFTILIHQGKDTKSPSAHIPLTYIHIFCSPYWPLFIRYGKQNQRLCYLMLQSYAEYKAHWPCSEHHCLFHD